MFDFYDWVLSFELVYNENLKVCQSTIVICRFSNVCLHHKPEITLQE